MIWMPRKTHFWVPRMGEAAPRIPAKFIDGQWAPGQRMQLESGDLVPGIADPPDIVIGANGTTYIVESTSATYTATGLVAVAANERAVIAVAGRAAATRTITGVTIGGQPCDGLAQVQNSGSTGGIWLGPLGVSGNVGITLDNSWLRCAVNLWPCQNIQGDAATDTGSATGASPLADTIDCLAGGAVFGVVYNSDTNSFTWTGISETFENNYPAGSDRIEGGASVFASAQTGLSVSVTVPDASTSLMALVALR